MANPEHLAFLKKRGVSTWNAWRKENPDIRPLLQKANLRETDLQEANLAEAKVWGADLQGASLQWAKLQEADLQKTNLQKAKLNGADLKGADLREANFQEANLQGANLREADLMRTKLQRANLQSANLWGADLQKANLQKTNLREAILEDADLRGADLRRADLGKTNLQGADLRDADLSGAKLQRANLRGAKLQEANLTEADCRNVILKGAMLTGANLNKATLKKAHLESAHLSDANLQDADLCGADLLGAILTKADLRNSLMKKTLLNEVNLLGAKLTGADLDQAKLQNALFSSRSMLNELAHPLTDEQLAGAIFEDEQEFYSKTKREAPREAPSLRIRFDDDKPWDAARFGIFFATLHTAYARLLFLATTEDEDRAAILRVLDRRAYHLPPEQDIYLESVSTGTLTADLVTYLSDPANLNAVGTAVGTALAGLGFFLERFTKILLNIAKIQEKRANTELKKLEAKKLRRELEKQQRRQEHDENTTLGFLTSSLPKQPLMTSQETQEDTSLAQEALDNMDLKNVLLVLEPKSKTVRDHPELIGHAARELSLSVTDLTKLGKPPTVVKTGTRGDTTSADK